jgi:hypothetical protein
MRIDENTLSNRNPMDSAKQVLIVSPIITFRPIARIKEVLPDILEPEGSMDLSVIAMLLGVLS